MGERGPGATRLRIARQTPLKKRTLPWKKKGLSRVARVIEFLQFLPITKGKLVGKSLRLLPVQRDFVERIYSETTISVAALSMPRGNGKTGLLAGLGLAHLLGPECEPRGEVYSAAIDRQQAGIMFAEMEAVILQIPEFAQAVKLQRFHKRIEIERGDGEGSLYEALSADARRAHGLAPSLWIYDELAQAKDRILLDNLMTAMGKRNRSLGIIISTQAPTDEHPLSQLLDLAAGGTDPSLYAKVICAGPDDDVFDMSVIEACNPAIDIFLDRGELAKSADRASRAPAFEPAHRNLRCNQRVDTRVESRLFTKTEWDRGSGPVNVTRLAGRECYAGLDLSGKADLTALALVFPDAKMQQFDVLVHFWTPAGSIEARPVAERDLFKLWIKKGLITEIPGDVIRFDFVAAELGKIAERYDILSLAYDRWRIDDFKLELADAHVDLKLEAFGQGYKDMAPAIDFLADKALAGGIRHGGNPVLAACFANAVVVTDPAGNRKLDKSKSTKAGMTRIDGAVALIMAMGAAARREPDAGKALSDAILARGGFA